MATDVTSFSYTVERKDRVFFFVALNNGEESNFFGPIIMTEHVDQLLTVRNMNAEAVEKAILEVAIQGMTSESHRIKVLFPSLRQVDSVFGTGRPGTAEGSAAQFFEPGGLAAAPGRLYIADTNNHRCCLADLAVKTVTAIRLRQQNPA